MFFSIEKCAWTDFRGAWTLLGECLERRLERLLLIFQALADCLESLREHSGGETNAQGECGECDFSNSRRKPMPD